MIQVCSLLRIFAAYLVVCGIGVALAAEPDAAETTDRPYKDGPLTAADFQGKRPDDATTTAWTDFDFRYHYRYQVETRGATRVATVTEIEVWAVILRDKSWNTRLKDPALLDHEQGHFDIAQAFAIEAQLKLQAALKTADVPQASGANQKEALKKLEKQVFDAIQTFLLAGKEANQNYDKETERGANLRAQANARKAQRARLEELHAKLKKLEEK